MKLSNAVCRGRRRTNFPKCKGCQFNDDERARPISSPTYDPAVGCADSLASDARSNSTPASVPASPSDDTVSRNLAPLFRAADIRGLYPLPLSTDVAWRIGYSAAQFLRSKLKGYDRATPQARSLVTACDLRSASAPLHTAMVNGVRAAGVTVHDIGAVDTPQLGFAVRRLAAGGGIITTGGRSPVAYSGFKICGAGGRDVATTTGLIDICDIAGRVPLHETGTLAGRFEIDLTEPYRDYLLQFLLPTLPRSIKLVVDASDGAAGRWVPAVLGEVPGLTVLMLNDAGAEPFAHEPDPSDAANLTALRRAVRQHKADLGVCFDGDADACAFVDERGAAVRPDTVAMLLARILLERGGGAVVADQRLSPLLRDEIERGGGTLRRERGGSAHMRKAMVETNALFGATVSGQYFFRDNAMGESGLLALVQMLNVLCASNRKLSESVKPLQLFRAIHERRLNVSDPDPALVRLAAHLGDRAEKTPDGVTIRDEDGWYHLVRLDGEAALILRAEATAAGRLRERVGELAAALGERSPS